MKNCGLSSYDNRITKIGYDNGWNVDFKKVINDETMTFDNIFEYFPQEHDTENSQWSKQVK